ncbi:MAG: cation:proton antiporter [Hyphomicrobiales bacterium]|nr:cation:proton antiporter [Hyphomicrobiales bacterium]
MELVAQILIALILARAFGEFAERFRQPSSVGEIVAGIILAGTLVWVGEDVPIVGQMVSAGGLEEVANIGMFCLVLLAGVDMEPREVAESSGRSLSVALGGIVVPFSGGLVLAWLFLPESDLRQTQALLVGVAVSITAIPAVVKMFAEVGALHSRVGKLVVSAAIFDDVIGLFLLALILAVIETGHIPDPTAFAFLLAKVVAFFGVTVALGVHVYPKVSRRMKALQAAAFEFSALAAVALAYGLLADGLGLHWILGGFMAGLFFEKSRVGVRAYNEIRLVLGAITFGFLGPIFFLSIGLRVELGAIIAVPIFLIFLIAIAFFGKLVGAGIPALLTGLDRREACAVGIGMSARGAVELAVLNIAYQAGLFPQHGQGDSIAAYLFSALILMGVITTLLAPILLRLVLGPRSIGQQ